MYFVFILLEIFLELDSSVKAGGKQTSAEYGGDTFLRNVG
jgi:hypothetical protein